MNLALMHICRLRLNHRSVAGLKNELSNVIFDIHIIGVIKGIARTQSPTIKNYALELPTFGVIVGVSLIGVQWRGLTLEEPPS